LTQATRRRKCGFVKNHTQNPPIEQKVHAIEKYDNVLHDFEITFRFWSNKNGTKFRNDKYTN